MWKRKPRFKVRRGGLSLYARVICRLAWVSGLYYQVPVAPEYGLNASSLSKRSRSTGLCRGEDTRLCP